MINDEVTRYSTDDAILYRKALIGDRMAVFPLPIGIVVSVDVKAGTIKVRLVEGTSRGQLRNVSRPYIAYGDGVNIMDVTD